MPNIYVLSKEGKPLMPIHSFGRVNRILKSHKARIVKTKPFTVQLTYIINEPVLDRCLASLDPGRTNVGVCVIDSKGHVLFASDVETRNKAIAKLMLERKAHRQASRRGERLVHQRRAIRADITGMAKATEFWRILPGYEEPICCKVFRNSKARFNNRKRPDGWLTPTANQLLQTHVNLIKKLQEILPITDIVIEINRFDFAKMENPNIQNWEYQKGRLFGYKSVQDALYHEQDGKCLLCGKDIEHYHHLIPRTKNGSNSINNQVGLCNKCHTEVHKNPIKAQLLATKKQGLLKKYGALSVVNQIMPQLLKQMSDLLPTYVTTGYETKKTRELYDLPKDHYIDAWCIAISVLHEDVEQPDFTGSIHNIRQYRRHNRQMIHAQKQRVYKLDGKAVCYNRHKPISADKVIQSQDSLEEYRKKYPQNIARLQVHKSTRSYNNLNRVLPGATFLAYNGSHILQQQANNGTIFRGLDSDEAYKVKEINIIKQNTGLVFI